MLNVLVAGQSGSGKSSIVNLIAGKNLAKTSPDADSCTKCCTEHIISVDGKKFRVFDMPGFLEHNSPEDRRLYAEAIADTYSMISKNGGLDLVLYCVNALKIKEQKTQNNYRLLHEVLCDEEVPIGIVLTYCGSPPVELGPDDPDHYKSIFVARNIACVSCITADVDSVGSKTQDATAIRDAAAIRNAAAIRDATAIRKLLSTYCGAPESRSKLRQLRRIAKDLVGRGQSLKKGQLSTLLTRQCNLDAETANSVVDALIKPNLSPKNRFSRATYARGKSVTPESTSSKTDAPTGQPVVEDTSTGSRKPSAMDNTSLPSRLDTDADID